MTGGGLDTKYAAELTAFLKQEGESGLSRGYQLGRSAVAEGLGLLDVVTAHERALVSVLPSSDWPERSRLERAANDFLREVLSPFEMTLSGYRESNQKLRRLNETLQEQKEELARLNRDLESFTYSVSHDLRAPVRSVVAFGQLLAGQVGHRLDAQGTEYLRFIVDEAKHMNQMMDAFLGLSQVTKGEMQIGPIDLTKLSQQIEQRLRTREPGRQVDLVIQGGLSVQGDSDLIELAMSNLIGNAWKFTSKQPDARIEVGTTDEGGRLVYFVRDNGAGFDMMHSGQLFGVFKRLHSSDEFEGTGIGLATVERVIRRHGGHIWAEAREGAGATFYFTLDDRRRLESKEPERRSAG